MATRKIKKGRYPGKLSNTNRPASSNVEFECNHCSKSTNKIQYLHKSTAAEATTITITRSTYQTLLDPDVDSLEW